MTFINFAIEANLVLLFFLTAEKIFLRTEKLFSFRRFFLLTGIFVSLTLPSLKKLSPFLNFNEKIYSISLPPITVIQNAGTSSSTIIEFISYLYFFGVFLFVFIFSKHLFALISTWKKQKSIKWNNLIVFNSNQHENIFSFFHFVVIGKPDRFSSWEKDKILNHELIHAQRLHSLDLLLINLVQIMFWFNPILFFYKNELIQLHEFEADARSVDNSEEDLYCSLLAKVALQSNGFALANHFTQSFTLKRILMIKSTNKTPAWKIFVLIPCTILFLSLMCNVEPLKAQSKSSEKVFSEVDEMPEYPGGWDEMYKVVAKTLSYPKSAREKKIEGKVFIQFVVEKDGTISSVSVKKGFNTECDEAALKTIKSLTAKWTPGKKSGETVRTEVSVPIIFKI
ncbi:MAG TPA: M56 family metallopeptidase [Cyclobacteriaceae bacterium]|jgi:TonB family protein|nr:M56 family metallopeptidase [Cyclobacteriaceae bacterium]